MAHLIRPVLEEPLSIDECLTDVQRAHDFLVAAARRAVERLHTLDEPLCWGSAAKRVRVQWSKEEAPENVADAPRGHNLVEVINQCATVERLLDTLRICRDDFPQHRVVVCHPTTSSWKHEEGGYPDNDLVLEGPAGQLLRFEVTDIVARGDSNRKERSSLQCLDVLRKGRTVAERQQVETWPPHRCFIATSKEFGEYLLRRRSNSHYRYDATKLVAPGDTIVLEVLPA